MGILLWGVLGAVAALFLLRAAGIAYFRRYVAWETQARRGLNYYGKRLAQRRAFKQEIRRRSRPVFPVLWLETRLKPGGFGIPSIEVDGVTGPHYSCTAESFRAAAAYRPTAQDIFVATQMKCGTTWMQQVVYEILTRGNGDLSDSGHGHLYAVSPWIEAVDGVSMEKAPLVGTPGRRIIKTHMPVQLTPYSPEAKYVYVTRHPVSCFASVLDYFELMAGPLAPPREQLLEWYCSDRMWWRSWVEHAAGWWDWAQGRPNVRFFHFEEMKRDLQGVTRQVAEFLGQDLSGAELERVLHKAGFQYMKKHEELFEMSPPNLFSVSGTYFKSGQANRNDGVPEAETQRILAFCREKLAGRSYPAGQFYPDILQAGAASHQGVSPST